MKMLVFSVFLRTVRVFIAFSNGIKVTPSQAKCFGNYNSSLVSGEVGFLHTKTDNNMNITCSFLFCTAKRL